MSNDFVSPIAIRLPSDLDTLDVILDPSICVAIPPFGLIVTDSVVAACVVVVGNKANEVSSTV